MTVVYPPSLGPRPAAPSPRPPGGRAAVAAPLVPPPARAVQTPSRVRPGRRGGVRWAYGITTVPSRKADLFPATLRSLAAAGFDSPRLFVDGAGCDVGLWYERVFGLPVTARGPAPVRTAANWFLSLAELYCRDPWADRYAVFQDDLVSSLGLRAFLEATCGPPPEGTPGVRDRERVYWNLYTFGPRLRNGLPYQAPPPPGADPNRPCWYASNQQGRGAVGLVFTGAGVRDLLSSRHAVDRPLDKDRGWRAVDGAIVTALGKLGYTELVHCPSPLQHNGRVSSMGSREHEQAPTFRGTDFDLTSLLG